MENKKAPLTKGGRNFWPVNRQPVYGMVESVFFLVSVFAIVIAEMQRKLQHTFFFKNVFDGFKVQTQGSLASVARKRRTLVYH